MYRSNHFRQDLGRYLLGVVMATPRQDDESPSKIVRQIGIGALTTIVTTIILTVVPVGFAIRDGLRDNTLAVKSQASETARLTQAVQGLESRFAAKDLKDQQQDFRLDRLDESVKDIHETLLSKR